MRHLARRSRGPVIAIAVLAISAGVALAGGAMPDAAADGLEVAAEAAGKTVPVVPAVDVPTPTTEAPEQEVDDPEDDARDNHGALVSEAAQVEELPEGFENRGEYVSCVARLPHGEDDPAVALADVTKAMCDEAKPGKSGDAGKPDEAGKPADAGSGGLEPSAGGRDRNPNAGG